MIKSIETFKKFIDIGLDVLIPTILIAFSLTVVVGVWKWSYKKREQLAEASKSPILMIVWILLAIIIVAIYFIYIRPMLKF